MPHSLPTTRRYLQTLTRRIERLETGRVVGYMPMGTGIRAFQRDLAARVRRQHRASELRAQRQLVKTGLLQIIRKGKSAEIRLTQNGCAEVLKEHILMQNQMLSEGWMCIVVFDIPEDVKTLRKSFRRFLKQAEFHQLQLSVWATHKDVVRSLSCLIKFLEIEKWVKVFVGIIQ